MRKKLTKAARCAIKMRSKEKNTSVAIRKLQEDIYNGPLHCFGLHEACSPDYCKTAQSKLTPTEFVADSSGNTNTTLTASACPSPIDVYSADENTSVDFVEHADSIIDIVEEQITFWEDSTNGEDEVNETPVPLSTVDQQMLYDIQQCTRRLVGKAAYLIGKEIM